NRELSLFLAILSLYLILCGLLCKGVRISFFEIITISAEDDDHYRKYAEKSYIAMGIMGLACLALMFLVDGEYSGPVLGSILSVVGFGAYGKALPSAAPVVSGALLAAVISMFSTGVPYNQGSFLTAAFFSTCLSPLAKHFGPGWGILAGFLHLSLAVNVTVFHGGMNLYNNGFAGGLAAMLLLPIIRLFRENP
ncbi:MAG: DUF1576 domain-containing protein, partial [Symbiobacteriaceae bacterium]|nr:DUF1576 domain-containing protein [Symbiobacteriaceae bacterium]